MGKVMDFITKYCGKIGVIVAAIALVVMIAFLIAGNGLAAGVSLCIGIFLGAPFRIMGELSLHEINSKEGTKEIKYDRKTEN